MRRFSPVPIRYIALAFIVGLLLLTGIVGAIASYQTRSVAHSMAQHAHDVARTELTAAIERLVGQMSARAQALAEWDETRQQLVMPEYYTHWRDHRVYENRMINGPASRVALYAADGRILAPAAAGPAMPAVFPRDWPANRSAARLVRTGDAAVLYVAFPLFSDAHRHALLGHGILRIDFMATLLEQNNLHFVDRNSIHIRAAENEEIDAADILSRLTFSPLPNADEKRFLSILSRTLIALLSVLGVAALAGLAVYSRLLVRPLRRLSRDLDAMQQGQFRTDGVRARPMHVRELENIRRSLYDYQLQLRKLHGSLDDVDSMVITEDNYIDFLIGLIEGNPKLPDAISAIFRTDSILFIGYGLKDWNIRVFLRYFRKDEDIRSFAVQRDVRVAANEAASREWESMVLYWERKNISVYNCDALAFLRELDRRYQEGLRHA